MLLLSFTILNSWSQSPQEQKYIDSIVKAAQDMPDDSLKVAAYGTLFEKLQFSDLDLANSYTQKGLNLSRKIRYKKGIAAACFQLADFHRFKGRIDSARFYYDKSQMLASEAKSLKLELFVNHPRAAFERSMGNYNEALSYAYRNIDIYNERDTTKSDLNKTFSLIGSEYELIRGIHLDKANYQIALSETLRALHFFEEKKDTLRKGDALMQIGMVEKMLENHESAIKNVKEAREIYSYFNDNQYKAYASSSIGSNYLELKQPEKAEFFFNEALEISKKIEILRPTPYLI